MATVDPKVIAAVTTQQLGWIKYLIDTYGAGVVPHDGPCIFVDIPLTLDAIDTVRTLNIIGNEFHSWTMHMSSAPKGCIRINVRYR